MVALTYPGVYIQEVPSGVRTITGVSTSTALFIGRTERGVMDKPTRVFNYTEFANQFGTSTAFGELPTQVRLFFANGGQQAYIMRIAQGAAKASVTLKNTGVAPVDVLRIEAREAGERGGELRVAIDYNTPTPDSTFNLRLFRVNAATLQESELEVHSNLTMEPGAARFVEDVIAQSSQLATATKLSGDSSDEGTSVGARLFTGTGTEAEILAALGGTGKLRIESSGHDVATVDVEAGDIDAAVSSFDCEKHITTIGGKFTVGIRRTLPGSVRVLPSGEANDFATKLQVGVAQGGIEVAQYSSQRPAPSGIFTNGYGNIDTIAAFSQATYTNFNLTFAGKLLSGFSLATSGTQFFQGISDANDSLRNVREKLGIFVSQFNDKAAGISDFNWKAEVQGFLIVFKPTAGPANAGLGAGIVETTTDLFDTADGFAVTSTNTRYYLLGTTSTSAFQSGTNGSDGAAPGVQEYADAYDVVDREVDIFNLLLLPRDVGVLDNLRKDLWGPASIFCQRRRAFLLVDPPSSWASIADVTGAPINIATVRIGLVKDHSAVYWPRLLAANEHGLVKPVDPSGAIAGIMARTDGNRGVWKAPAGLEADVRGITGVERAVSDPENGVTNALALNTIRVFPNGIVSWGARTVDGFDNSGNNDYKYVPVRRLALFLAESLRRGLQFAVFEPNDEPLWAQIRLAAGAFMNGLFRQGAFQGQKKSDAYFVKVDSETTTQNDINLGIVNVIVGFAPLKPAEFVVVHLKQIAGQIQT